MMMMMSVLLCTDPGDPRRLSGSCELSCMSVVREWETRECVARESDMDKCVVWGPRPPPLIVLPHHYSAPAHAVVVTHFAWLTSCLSQLPLKPRLTKRMHAPPQSTHTGKPTPSHNLSVRGQTKEGACQQPTTQRNRLNRSSQHDGGHAAAAIAAAAAPSVATVPPQPGAPASARAADVRPVISRSRSDEPRRFCSRQTRRGSDVTIRLAQACAATNLGAVRPQVSGCALPPALPSGHAPHGLGAERLHRSRRPHISGAHPRQGPPLGDASSTAPPAYGPGTGISPSEPYDCCLDIGHGNANAITTLHANAITTADAVSSSTGTCDAPSCYDDALVTAVL